jgi:hypothetical protein
MDAEIFAGFEKFRQFFTKPDDKPSLSPISLLFRSGDLIDSLNTQSIIETIHQLTGKWPHNKNITLLRKYLKRYIQLLYYKDFYGKEPSQRVHKDTEKFYASLKLEDTRPPITQKPATIKKKPKKKTLKLYSKIRSMELTEIEAWARALGVPDKSIKKNISKPGNYAKSYMANVIKHKLPEDHPLLELTN